MHIFISWSGERSRAVATALREWLPHVIQSAEPWMSSEDIDKGARWAFDLSSRLQNTHAGIICLTPENLSSEWIHFEAGALSKVVEDSRVCPYLFQLHCADLAGPLSQFQAVTATERDTFRMVAALNEAGERPVPDAVLVAGFQRCWAELEHQLDAVSQEKPAIGAVPKRSTEEVIVELLQRIRSIERLHAEARAEQSAQCASMTPGTGRLGFSDLASALSLFDNLSWSMTRDQVAHLRRCLWDAAGKCEKRLRETGAFDLDDRT